MISGKNMQHIDTSTKIKCLIEMALKSEMSWLALDPVIDKLTPTLEKSRQIVKILLKEFETHQSICTLKTPNDGNNLSEDITVINEDEFNSGKVKMIHGNSSEEIGIRFTEEKLMKVRSEENLMNKESENPTHVENKIDLFTDEHDESRSNFCGIDSEDDEVIEENDISKNIQLVEAFKGQLYTFIGENSVGEFEENSYNQSMDHIESNESKKNLKVYSKKAIGMLKETSLECETCGKCFKKRRILNVHLRIHTGEKPFQCGTCKKSFGHSSTLKAHERTHTGEKPFQCKSCKKSFTEKTNLKTHERIHTGEKPYQCVTCKKFFSKLGNLKTHETTHTGEKSFQCETCKKCFSRLNYLKIHERTQHTG